MSDQKENIVKKPPLGIAPKFIAIETYAYNRVEDILDAMERYSNDNEPIPVEWIIELRELLSIDTSAAGGGSITEWWSHYLNSMCDIRK